MVLLFLLTNHHQSLKPPQPKHQIIKLFISNRAQMQVIMTSTERAQLGILDFIVLASVLVISSLIGVYYAIMDRRQVGYHV